MFGVHGFFKSTEFVKKRFYMYGLAYFVVSFNSRENFFTHFYGNDCNESLHIHEVPVTHIQHELEITLKLENTCIKIFKA